MSGFLFGLVTELLRFLGGQLQLVDLWRLLVTLPFATLLGLLIGVVILWRENRPSAKRGSLRKQLTDEHNSPL